MYYHLIYIKFLLNLFIDFSLLQFMQRFLRLSLTDLVIASKRVVSIRYTDLQLITMGIQNTGLWKSSSLCNSVTQLTFNYHLFSLNCLTDTCLTLYHSKTFNVILETIRISQVIILLVPLYCNKSI